MQTNFKEIICINNKKSLTHGNDCALTVGKKYYIFEINEDDYTLCSVLNDNKNIRNYKIDRFLSTEEYRDMQLNKIGI